jgi:hypothetical protein
MKIALRLLVGVFSLLLLVGCGGGGGNGDGDGGGAAPTIDDSFPKLTTVGSVSVPSTPLVPILTIRQLAHWDIPKSDRDLFEINLQERGFQWIRASDTYERNITNGSTTYKATARIAFAPGTQGYTITLKLENEHGDVPESLFEDIFSHIPGKFFEAHLSQGYSGDQSAAFEAYWTKLRDSYSFERNSLGDNWVKFEDGFQYIWSHTASRYSSTAVWMIK